MKQWWQQGVEAAAVPVGQTDQPRRRISFNKGTGLAAPLLGDVRSAKSTQSNSNWAAESEDQSRAGQGGPLPWFDPSVLFGKNCMWRDIALVGAVTMVNTYLAESIPMLADGKSMPVLMSQLFSKKLDQTTEEWADPVLGAFLTILVIFIVKWVMTFISLGLPNPTGVVLPTMIIGALLGRLFANLMPMWLVNWLLSDQVTAFSYDIPAASPDAVGAFAARFAIVGAGAFCTAVTGCFSMAITIFEVLALPNSVLPLACASLCAIRVSTLAWMGHSFYDQILVDSGWHGISAMASKKFSQAPASKVMKPYIDFRSECCPRFASLCDIKRFLELPREVECDSQGCGAKIEGNDLFCPRCHAERPEEVIPIVQYSRNRFWGAQPLLAGATTIDTMHEVLNAWGEDCHYDPEFILDFLDPDLLGPQDANSAIRVERTPQQVEASVSIKDVFVLLKVTSSYNRMYCYVTSHGRLLGVIRHSELLGKGASKAA